MKQNKQNKYIYLKVLQGYYYEWGDLVEYTQTDPEDIKELRSDLKAYRENDPRPYRVITRRQPNKINN